MQLNHRQFIALSAGTVAGSLMAGAVYIATNDEADEPVVERVRIPLKNLPPAPDGLRIVFLSDFHLYPFTGLDLHKKAAAFATPSRKQEFKSAIGVQHEYKT